MNEAIFEICECLMNKETGEVVLQSTYKGKLIRCRDCEYYHPYYCEKWSKFGTIQTPEDGYCHMAERREDPEEQTRVYYCENERYEIPERREG